MNKKVNTLLFVLCGTLFNILVAVISFLLLLLLYARFIVPLLPEGSGGLGITIIFIAAIVISFISYRMLFKFLVKKVDVEKYFDPIFTNRRRPRNN